MKTIKIWWSVPTLFKTVSARHNQSDTIPIELEIVTKGSTKEELFFSETEARAVIAVLEKALGDK